MSVYLTSSRNLEAYKLIFEYIETFYNTVRIHSHCNYQSPNQYEKSYVKSN
ncbi:IS3 family transposase [Catenibacterium mitsuokai]|uniref:IS3 family transposase n=1 Tax=Catenibacterium mitsuokai TaxID=100886 RepID=UPI0039B0FF11